MTTDARCSARHSTTPGRTHPGTSATDAIRAWHRAWPTPLARDRKGQTGWRVGHGAALPDAVAAWYTAELGRRNVHAWPTPTASRGGSQQNGTNASRPSGGTPTLATLGRSWASTLHDPETQTPGPPGSPQVAPNPEFHEALMGLPWTWTDSDSSAAELTPWWSRMRSALSQLERSASMARAA